MGNEQFKRWMLYRGVIVGMIMEVYGVWTAWLLIESSASGPWTIPGTLILALVYVVLVPWFLADQVGWIIRDYQQRRLEKQYQALGRWKGTVSEQSAVRAWWLAQPALAADWLTKRLRHENNLETLDAVASVLADLGDASVHPICLELQQSGASVEQTVALLQALRWNTSKEKTSSQCLAALQKLFLHPHPDVREGVAKTLGTIRSDQIKNIVYYAKRDERHPDVSEALEVCLAQMETAGA